MPDDARDEIIAAAPPAAPLAEPPLPEAPLAVPPEPEPANDDEPQQEPAPVEDAAPARRHAVVLIPGMRRVERNAARAQLVSNLLVNETMPVRRAGADDEGEVKLAGAAGLRLAAMPIRIAAPTVSLPATVDVFEAYWGDVVPVEAEQQPFRRMTRGFALVWYWLFSRMWCAFSLTSWRLSAGLMFGGVALVIWYLSILGTAAQLWGQPEAANSPLVSAIKAIFPFIHDGMSATVAWLLSWRIWPLLTFLLPISPFMIVVDHAQALRELLSNTPDDKGVGRRSRVRQAVGDVLSAVLGARNDRGDLTYDEVTVVAHSFGTIILIDLLADWPHHADFARLEVVTLGSPQKVLAYREKWLKTETEEALRRPRLNRWIDISATDDTMSAPIAGHKAVYGDQSSIQLDLGGSWQLFGTSTHDAYITSPDVLKCILK